MKKQFLILSSIIFILVSCQKEVDFATGGSGGGGTANQKLVRIGTRSGADTTTTDYGYNTAGKLIRQYITGNASGTPFYVEIKLNRNTSGIITNVVIKSDQLAVLGLDSIVTRVNYNSGTTRYTSSVTTITLFGFTVKDSSAYTYDGTGRITQEESFTSNPLTSIYEKSTRTVFTWLSGTNLGNEKYYDWDDVSNSYVLSEEWTHSYDAKQSPLQMGMEAIFVGDLIAAASNNLIKSVYVDATDPANNETTDVVYTYNSANKPATATSTLTPGGAMTKATYTYQ